MSNRLLRIRHTTTYTYDAPVTRSAHRLHLRPVHDWRQSVVSHSLDIRPRVPTVEFEDVFGNQATRFEITQPYTELRIAAESVVEVKDVDPFAFADLPIRPASFPLVWMPWERTMLAPYLNPAELPDTQLQEGSSPKRVGGFGRFQIGGSMQVRILSRRYSSSRNP